MEENFKSNQLFIGRLIYAVNFRGDIIGDCISQMNINEESATIHLKKSKTLNVVLYTDPNTHQYHFIEDQENEYQFFLDECTALQYAIDKKEEWVNIRNNRLKSEQDSVKKEEDNLRYIKELYNRKTSRQ